MKLLLNNTAYDVVNESEALNLVCEYCDENNFHYTKARKEDLPEGVRERYDFFEFFVNEYGDAQIDYFDSAYLV